MIPSRRGGAKTSWLLLATAAAACTSSPGVPPADGAPGVDALADGDARGPEAGDAAPGDGPSVPVDGAVTDAAPTCGNGVVDPGETCDSNCPLTCDDGDACTTDVTAGSAAACSLACTHTPTATTCTSGDGCCPAACTHDTDTDCPFYVDAVTGNDSNNGLTPATAWQTAAHAASAPLAPGDHVAFRRGEVWHETLHWTASGSAASPIVVTGYGDGAVPPTFSPTRAVTGWTAGGARVYAAALGVAPVQVLVDGVRLALAHFPDAGYLYVDADETGATSFVDNDLARPASDLVGATVLMRLDRWDLNVGQVAGFASHRVSLTAPIGSGGIPSNVGYVLANKLWMLDQPGEWFYDASAHQLSVRLPDDSNPSTHQVEVSTAVNAIELPAARNVVLEGLGARAAGLDGILVQAPQNVQIRDCVVQTSGAAGIDVASPPTNAMVTVENDAVADSYNAGILVTGDYGPTAMPQHVTLRGNRVERTGRAFPLAGGGSSATAYGWGFGMAMHVLGVGADVEDNTVLDAGYSCVVLNGADHTVRHNDVERCCLVFDDGAGIYMNGSGHQVLANTVVDSIGAYEGTPTYFTDHTTRAQGIYADDLSNGITIDGNTVANADYDVQLHDSHDDHVHANVLYASRRSGVYISEDATAGHAGFVHGNVVDANVMLSPTGARSVTEDYSLGRAGPFASYDANTYWHLEGSAPFERSIASSGTTDYSLAQWRVANGTDAHSTDLETTYRVYPIAGRPTGAANLVSNGSFDANIAGWGAYPSSTTIAWADAGLTDGGLSASGSDPHAVISSASFPVVADAGYLLRFSARAATPVDVTAIVRHSSSGYEAVGESTTVNVGPARTDYVLPFVATASLTARVDFATTTLFAFLLDDVDLRLANVARNDPADDGEILLNPTATARAVDLAGRAYCDVAGGTVTGAVTVAAYGSEVLLSCQCNNDDVCDNRETVASCPRDCP